MLKIFGILFLGVFAFCTGAEESTRSELPELTESTEKPSKVFKTVTDSQNVELIKPIDEEDFSAVEIKDPNAKELTWPTLADVEYKDVYIEELDAWFWEPNFGEKIKAFEGEQVYITGYMVPVDIDADYFVLSRYPFASCFFCGKAGPESVVDLRLENQDRKFTEDERLTFTGTLRLNETDVYELNYILEKAEENL